MTIILSARSAAAHSNGEFAVFSEIKGESEITGGGSVEELLDLFVPG